MFGLDFQTTTLAVRQKPFALDPKQIANLIAWYDPSDLTTLFQDAAGTISVTSFGDPVGLLQDKSGNGYHLTQSVSEARPVYKTDGTRHWIESNGTNTSLSCSSRFGLSANPNLTVSAALQPLSHISSWDAVFGIGSGTGSLNGAFGTGGLSWRHINGATTFGGLPVGADAVVSWERSSGDSYKDERAYVDGIQRSASGSSLTVPTDTTSQFTLMSAGGTFANMSLYGLLILGSDSTEAREQAENWLATR